MNSIIRIACVAAAWASASHALHVAAADAFDWDAIVPTPELQYHKCYDGFRCARLTVPRDWTDMGNNKTVVLAVISLPATVPTDDPTFGGSIIINPGGPGGSGVNFAKGHAGRMLQRMADGKKHYEIVSFDPRGVGNTWPPVNCFGRSQMLARDALAIEWQGVGGLEFGETNLKHGLALQDGLGAVCANMDDDEDILSYVSTAYVARDIVEIADRIEEQRSASHKAKRFLETNSQAPLHDEVPPAAPAAGGMKHARVIYWGFSYGTLLGNTLASMFPGRMGRVILDGVADIDDYMTASWSKNLLDTEKIVDSFYDSCFEVTKDCALWKESDISSDDIRSRVNALIVDLDANPRTIVPNNGESTVRVVTGNDIRETFRQPLYSPIPTGFTNLAINIAAALKGNYSLVGGPLLPPLRDACQIDDQGTPSTMETTSSIACGDAYYAHEDASPHYGAVGFSFAYWQAYVEKLRMQSPTFMPFWSRFSSSCSGWRVKPKWGFKGPWTTPPASLDDDDAPDAPILFTSSRLDPVTPLVNAFAMSNSHPGSSVLLLDGLGHCAISGGWSECFNAAIRAYLDDGVMPENGTMCADSTCKPFSKDSRCLEPPSSMLQEESWYARSVREPLAVPF